MMMRTGARIWSVLASTSVRVASPSIFLTVESTRAETAGYAPGPRENTLEGRGLVLAVSGGAVLGGGTAPCLRGPRCSPKNAGSPDVKVAPERRGVCCMGDSPPRRGSSSMAPKRDSCVKCGTYFSSLTKCEGGVS